MKILIAVMTCHKHRPLCDVQRQTWGRDVEGMDLRFFIGGGEAQRPDEVILDCPDGYRDLPSKCMEIFKWALEHGYDYVFKTDSDVYIRPERLLAAVPVGKDYVGRLRGPARGYPAPYCSGMGYWLSRKALQARVDGGNLLDFNEDLTTGNILLRAGIVPYNDPRYCVVMSQRSALNGREGPRVGNDVIASCEYDASMMRVVHQEYLTMPSGEGNLKMPMNTPFDRIDVLVKTFLRDGMMIRCTKGIEQNLPGARIILVDDGWESPDKVSYCHDLRVRGHVVERLPFDSGYGAKNNAAAQHYDREFVLRASDDFDFSDPSVADGVLKMMDVMDHDPRIVIASGRVDNNPYEGDVMQIQRPDGLKDIVATRADLNDPFVTTKGTQYSICDYTVNYSLIRREVIQSFVWDEKFKMGGDHLDLYMHTWLTGGHVTYVHGANINTIPNFPGCQDAAYHKYRQRARLALPWTFERHGWNSFTGFDGTRDTRESVQAWVDKFQWKAPGKERMSPEARKAAKVEKKAMKKARAKAKFAEILGEWKYGITPEYIHREEVPHYDATTTEGEWQREVYELALKWAEKEGLQSVLDLGCGNGEKLLRYFGHLAIVGVEVDPTLTWLRKNHPEGLWMSPQEEAPQVDLLICADVIEHLQNPDVILEAIKKSGAKIAVISTPDRSLIPGGLSGPPRNIHHVREWTMKEFDAYLREHFDVLEHSICNPEQFTQVVVVRP
jgi:SAM-dependent methyltransferase